MALGGTPSMFPDEPLKPWQGAPFQRHSDTSIAAAKAAEPLMNALQREVLDYLLEHGPATDEQIQGALGMNPSTERPRRIELVNKALVVDSGETAKTRSGRSATLWKAAR